MRLPEPPTYAIGEIERRAHEFLRERYGSNVPIPVDVDLLLEKLPGVVLDYWPALRANHGLDGMVLRNVESGELVVHIDEQIADSQPNRYRMTVGYGNKQVILKQLAVMLARGFVVSVMTTEIRMTEWPTRLNDKVESAMQSRLDSLG